MKQLLTSLGVTNVENLDLGPFTLEAMLIAMLTFLVCLLAIKLVMVLFRKLLSRAHIDERVRRYTLAGIRTVLWIITILIVADSLGIPITSLVALLSVLSLGITLAVEDIIANIAGGLVLLSAHPFNIGDFVEAAGVSGTVKEITLNYTKLTTADGLQVLVPNKELADSKMTNYTVLGTRRVCQKVTASYDAPTETVKAACQKALEMTGGFLADPAPVIFLSNYGASSIEYVVRAWTSSADYWDVYFGVMEGVRESFARNGVEMTYDHLNVHVVEK